MTGGNNEHDGYSATASFLLKDNTWTELPRMKEGRSRHACDVFQGTLVVMGGESNFEDGDSSLEILDLSSLQWRFGPALSIRVHLGLSTVYQDILYLITGHGEVMSLVERWKVIGKIGELGEVGRVYPKQKYPPPLVNKNLLGC